MNEQSKISAPATTTEPTNYIRLEIWLKESQFDHVYKALHNIGVNRLTKLTPDRRPKLTP